MIVILDCGSQYTQLIARRIRELHVYCEIHPFNNVPDLNNAVKGVVVSGSPASVSDRNAPKLKLHSIKTTLPLLGICYGAQYLTQKFGGSVKVSDIREYGRANLQFIDNRSPLFKDISQGSQIWMSHGDTIESIPDEYRIIGSTRDVKVAAYHIEGEDTYGIQFHPEVHHSKDGFTLLKNFVIGICGCKQTWTPASFLGDTINKLKKKLGNDKVVLGLSGGVDSTVTAVLLSEAIGDRLYCIFVNNGLLRKNEFKNILGQYKEMGLNIKGVDSSTRFLEALNGISNPEAKRETIGRIFVNVFDDEASQIESVDWLAQGTIYSDVIESSSVKELSATIKSHHNVGGLPKTMNLKVVEPLNTLFKDEVRRIGKTLGIPEELLGKHPFPGPGLAIRILGGVTPEKVHILREADYIFINELKEHNLYDEVWQAAAILLPVQSVGVMGDERTYENVIALRAVESTDGMTADWAHLPYDLLAEVSNKIINRIRGINRVVYDISSKPPATIEWE